MLSDKINSRFHPRSNWGGALETAWRHALNGIIVQLTAHSPHANPFIYTGCMYLPAHIQNEIFCAKLARYICFKPSLGTAGKSIGVVTI